MSKWFALHPCGNVEGVVFDDQAPTRQAVFLTPAQAKFMASFRSIRESEFRNPFASEARPSRGSVSR